MCRIRNISVAPYGINEIIAGGFSTQEDAQARCDELGYNTACEVVIVDEDDDDTCSCPDFLVHGTCNHV